jgi:DNA-binding NarL/FixJ family response regulator
VLILTAHADHRLLMDAVKAGAAGYLLKGSDIKHALEAVRAVLDGETPLEHEEVTQLMGRLAREAGVRAGGSGFGAPEEGLPASCLCQAKGEEATRNGGAHLEDRSEAGTVRGV